LRPLPSHTRPRLFGADIRRSSTKVRHPQGSVGAISRAQLEEMPRRTPAQMHSDLKSLRITRQPDMGVEKLDSASGSDTVIPSPIGETQASAVRRLVAYAHREQTLSSAAEKVETAYARRTLHAGQYTATANSMERSRHAPGLIEVTDECAPSLRTGTGRESAAVIARAEGVKHRASRLCDEDWWRRSRRQ